MQALSPRGQRAVVPYTPGRRLKVYGSVLAGGAAAVGGYMKRKFGQYAAKQAKAALYSAAKKRYARTTRNRSSKKTIATKIKNIERRIRELTSLHIFRKLNSGSIASASNGCAYGSFELNRASDIEESLANLRFFDPSAPGTLITANGATGTYSRNFEIKSSFILKIKNNYQVPVTVRCWYFDIKADTNITPLVAFTDGLANVGSPSSTDPLTFPSDSDMLSDLWKGKGASMWHLKPGEFKYVHLYAMPIMYDPATYDSHNTAYQRHNKSKAVLLRVEGDIGHDRTTSSLRGTLNAGVDWEGKHTYYIKYSSGGADLKTVNISNNLDTFTDAGVVSQVVADNQVYSSA